MNKLNFEFKRNSDCQTIKLDDLDKMVCEEFNLEYGNINNLGDIDYGHFILDKDLYHQEYISWWGLIATILFYGNVNSGDISMRDVLGVYVFDVWKVYLDWPDESVTLVSKLLKFLQDKGLCIHTNWGL